MNILISLVLSMFMQTAMSPEDIAAIENLLSALEKAKPALERAIQPQPPVFMVNSASSLQNAINTVPGGSIIEADPGVYIGNFTFPAKPQLVTVNLASVELRSPSNSPAVQFTGSNWKLDGCGPEMVERFTTTLTTSGDHLRIGTHNQTLAEVPDNITLKCLFSKGHETNGDVRGVVVHGSNVLIEHWLCKDMKQAGRDTQCLAGWNGPGPLTVRDFHLEAAGENIMFGGADPSIPGMILSDILIEDGVLYKPQSWKGTNWTIKNLFESKASRRGIVRNVLMDGVWPPGQDGFAVLGKSTNQNSGCTWCVTEDWEFDRVTIQNATGGFKLAGKPEANPAIRANGFWIHDSIINSNQPWQTGATGRCLQVMGVVDVKFEHNDCQSAGWANTIYLDNAGLNSGLMIIGNILRDYTNSGGIKGDGQTEGVVSLNYYASGYVLSGNLIVSPQPNNYASTLNTIVSTMPSNTTGFGPR
jgi:hypothetical protein